MNAHENHAITRRRFLGRSGHGAAGVALASLALGFLMPSTFAARQRRLRVAAIITEYNYRSHAHVILENFLEPYLFNGKLISSGMDVASMYVDQVPAHDLSRAISAKYNIPIYRTIAESLCCGDDRLAVDAVLSIGEFGNGPM